MFVSISTISAADLNDFNSTDPVNTTLENVVNDSNGSTSIVNNSLSQPINKSKVATVITAPNVKANYAKGAKLSIYLKDAKGNALSNKTIFISISGISTVYKVTTNANGLAIFNFKKVPKTYNIVASFKGDEDYLSSKVSSKIVISKAATSIVAPTVKSYLTQSTYLKITLKDSAGNLVSKRKVTVTVGRKTYKLTTDAKGLAKLKFSNKIKNVKVSIKFKGDKYYFASSKSSRVIITKMPTTIVAPSIKFYSTQYGTFLITLKDKNGKGVKGKYVYAYISALKKTYKLKTNSSGVAKLKIGSIKTYSVAVKFKGDKKYISSSRSSKLNVIKVNVKFNDVINQILEDNIIPDGYELFVDNLKLLNEFNNILNRKSEERGYISFYSDEINVIEDSLGNPIDFKLNEQRTAQKIIENLMILANELIASNYSWCPFIYRVHDIPDNQKIKEILEFLRILGYRIQYIKNFDNPKIIQGLLKSLNDNENYSIISRNLLRGMKKAVYDTDNIGHFGLALENYTHFTSPIRRLPDLLVHMLIDKYESNYDIEECKKLEEYLKEACNHASYKERQAEEAEREADQLRMAQYMNNHIGEYFNGKIINISLSGVTVQTENYVNGYVLFSDIKGDFYKFDSNKFTITGKRNKETYKIGDNVRIKVKEVSIELRTINFEIKEKLNIKTLVKK